MKEKVTDIHSFVRYVYSTDTKHYFDNDDNRKVSVDKEENVPNSYVLRIGLKTYRLACFSTYVCLFFGIRLESRFSYEMLPLLVDHLLEGESIDSFIKKYSL